MEFERGGLVEVLEHLGVVLHRVDGPEFDLVTFKLDGRAHFATRIAAADVVGTALYTPCWGGRTQARNQVTGCGRQLETLTPLLKLRGLQHGVPS